MSIRSNPAFCGLLAALVAAPAFAGPDWTEVGDAGNFFGSAQIPAGQGAIHSISGSLGGRGDVPDYDDMYVIGVDDPGAFRLELTAPNFNAQLFIFNITLSGGLLGLLGNDDAAVDNTAPLLLPVATDGSGAILDLPGDYLVCVTGKGRNPTSAGGLIFDIQDPTEISGADGPGGLLRHIGWDGIGETGDYSLVMDGTVFPQLPAPSGLALLGVGGLAAARRRR
ncbi:MAG: hypothetical protein H6810_00010 [Phycisphaeraceae bacterium]|nr:MAG: hypothetical protein H6810_00010 [Phycisphaeraceae bacterium]